MVRKILIAGIASLSLLSPLTLPAQSEAHEVHVHVHAFRVYVRDCSREPWHFYGTYRHRDDAVHAVRHLHARGVEAYIR